MNKDIGEDIGEDIDEDNGEDNGEDNDIEYDHNDFENTDKQLEIVNENEYTHLILSGGGIKGIAIIGSLKALYEKNMINNLKGYIGSSVGGLICFLLNIGYNVDELYSIMLHIDFNKYREFNFSNFLDEWGFDSGQLFMKLVVSISKQKNISNEITFMELYKKTNKELVLTGSNIKHNEIIYYGYKTTPDMKIMDAIRITISYPFIFYPIKKDEQLLVDGGMFSPYPIEYFKDIKEKIGIVIHNKFICPSIESCEHYLITMINCIQERYEKIFLEKYEKESIILNIDNCNSMNFAISIEDKINMYTYGYNTALQFIM